MSLTERYHNALKQPDRVADKSQARAVELLDRLLAELVENNPRKAAGSGWLTKLPLRGLLPWQKRPPAITGLYLWGGVGRGKTWLMNLFYQELPFPARRRIHFHHFMLDIHEKLGQLKKQKNPLQRIARELAAQYRVLCIDEFIVTNITDAMILSELLHALFENGLCLVATSNRVPDDLYLNGLQRERFLPAIALIKQHMQVFHLDSGIDHRSALLELEDIYYSPADARSDEHMKRRMQELAVTPIVESPVLNVLNRDIPALRASEETAWFDFDILCSAPRAAQDYIELARRYSTIFLSKIPIMDEYSDDRARRFIYLIDELYDRNVSLICSAETQPDKLYRGTMLEFAFRRTASRLVEMRSHHYLNQPHKPF